MSKHLLFVAGSDIDYFYDVETFLGPSDACKAIPLGSKIGGCVLNAAAVSSMLGSDVKVLDCLKKDDEGSDLLIEGLKKNKVDTSFIEFDENAVNGTCLIMKKGDEKCIYVIDAKKPFYKEDEKMNKLLFDAKYVYSTMDILDKSFKSLDIIDAARKQGTKIVFDGGSQYSNPREKELVLNYADGLFMNTTAYKRLNEVCGFETIDYLLDRGLEFACITDGEKGASCYTKEGKFFEKALKVDVVDSTGAGDSFAGSFLHFKDKGFSNEECLKLAGGNGALACTKEGGMAGAVSEDELMNFMKDF